MGKDAIDQAIDLAISGQAKEGIRMLWPSVRDEASRSEALFALAYCFEQDGNLMTACYLYQTTMNAHPDFELAQRRLIECEELAEHRGLIEDFDDMGHQACVRCDLRFRSEYTVCPYCGTMVDSGEVYTEGPPKQKKMHENVEEDPTFSDHVVEIGRDAIDSVQDFIEGDTVKNLGKKISETSQSAVNKAKEWGQSEQGQKLGDKTDEVMQKVMGNERLRSIADSIEAASNKAAEKLKGAKESQAAKDTGAAAKKLGEGAAKVGKDAGTKVNEFMQSDSVKTMADRAKEAGRDLLKKLRGWDEIDEDKKDR